MDLLKKKKYGEKIYLANFKNFDSVFSISSLSFTKSKHLTCIFNPLLKP